MAEKCKDLSPMVSFDLIVEPSDQVKKRCGRRCSECGCEVCYTHDEGDYFPEECCVSASGEPFEDCCDDVYGTIGEAIREWTSKPFFTPFTSRCATLNHLRVNIKHFLGPILGAEVAQKRAPFPAVVTITEMGNANICILCDAVKKVERRVLSLL